MTTTARGGGAFRRVSGDQPGITPGAVLGGIAAGIAAGAFVGIAGPLPAIALVLGIVGLAVIARMPGVLLAMYLLIPFYKGAVQPYLPVDLTIILAFACMLQAIPWLLVPGSRDLRGISVAGTVLWVAIAALVLAGTLWAADPTAAAQKAGTFWILVVIPLVAACLRVSSKRMYVHQLAWSFFGLGALTVVLGMAYMTSTDRLAILGMNTINVAVAAMLVPLVGLAFVIGARAQWARIVALTLTPLAFLVALASGSRGAILTLLILGLVVGARSVARARVVRTKVVVGALLGAAAILGAVVLAWAVLPAASLARFTAFGSFVSGVFGGGGAPTGDTSSEARARLIGVAYQMWLDHPILGVGTAGFASLSPAYVGPLLADAYPHNSVMQFASEYGTVGVAAFGAFVTLALTRRLPRDAAWTTVRLLAAFFLLNGLLSNDILDDRTMWGLLLLLLLVRESSSRGGELDTGVVGEPTRPAASDGSGTVEVAAGRSAAASPGRPTCARRISPSMSGITTS